MEVTRAWEAATAAEATRAVVVLVAEISTQEAVATRGNAAIFVKDAEDRATMAEREAQERVSAVEAESVSTLTSAHEEAEGLVRKITVLEGELAEVHRAREVAKENSCGLSNVTANAEWQREESEREHREQVKELTLLQPGALSCALPLSILLG
jgi:hypothetical protein